MNPIIKTTGFRSDDLNSAENKTIRIGKSYVTKPGDGLVRLCADVALPGKTSQLWYGVEERYAYALVKDRSDPFVAALVHIIMLRRFVTRIFACPKKIVLIMIR